VIPLSHPHSTLTRISEPFTRRDRKRTRRRKDGIVEISADTQRFVTVRCKCGHCYDILLSAWRHRPPRQCIHCKGAELRTDDERARKHAAYMLGFGHGASGRDRSPIAPPGYDQGYAYGCKVRARVAKTAARTYRLRATHAAVVSRHVTRLLRKVGA